MNLNQIFIIDYIYELIIDNPYLLDDYKSEFNINYSNDKILLSSDFKSYLISIFNLKLNKFYLNLNNYIIDDYIYIYREMTVSDEWLKNLENKGKHLGIYWTYDENKTNSYWGYTDNNNHIIIKSKIKLKFINWLDTIRMNINPKYEKEKEIRLFKNSDLYIENIIKN
jgi:hypothetical protein